MTPAASPVAKAPPGGRGSLEGKRPPGEWREVRQGGAQGNGGCRREKGVPAGFGRGAAAGNRKPVAAVAKGGDAADCQPFSERGSREDCATLDSGLFSAGWANQEGGT